MTSHRQRWWLIGLATAIVSTAWAGTADEPRVAPVATATAVAAGNTTSRMPVTPTAAFAASTTPTAQDAVLIQALLDAYTASVSNGQRERFESLLLDLNIPFYGLPGRVPDAFTGGLAAVQNYAGFRRSVFESGTKFAQTFSNVKIDQDGDLAQVSLNFLTRRVASGEGGQGWKILHLLKVCGEWKIASEFYTVYSAPVVPAAPR